MVTVRIVKTSQLGCPILLLGIACTKEGNLNALFNLWLLLVITVTDVLEKHIPPIKEINGPDVDNKKANQDKVNTKR